MQVLIDDELCTACKICVNTCPQKILELVAKKTVRVTEIERCIGCFGCEDECREAAIRVRRAPQHVTDIQVEAPPEDIRHCDVAIVGAGPSGLGAAISAAKAGLDVVVFERLPNRQMSHHTDGGIMFTLPGVTSVKNAQGSVELTDLDITLAGDIANRIEYIGLLGPDGASTINDFPDDIEGWAQNKDAFVRSLVNLAEHHGARIWYNAKVVDVLKANGRVCGVELASGEKIGASVVVTADGVGARITKKAGFPLGEDTYYLWALTYEYPNEYDLPLGYHYVAGGMEPADEMKRGYISAQGAIGVTDTIHVAIGFLSTKRYYPAPRPLDYYVEQLIANDKRVTDVLGERLAGKKPTVLTGCRVTFRDRPMTDTAIDGAIAVGDAWVDDCDLGNIPSLANGVFAGQVIAKAAHRNDFSKEALSPANDYISEPILSYLAHSKKDKLCSSVLNEEELDEYFKFCKHLHYPPLVFGNKAQKTKALTRFMVGNAFRFLNVVKYPKLKSYVFG